MARRATQTREYWGEAFKLEQSDIEHLYNVLLESETPLSAEEMALVLVRFRVQKEEMRASKFVKGGLIYRPDEQYEVGAEIVLTAFGNARAKVLSQRAGNNPDYGDFSVIEVELEPGEVFDLAADLKIEHSLSNVEESSEDDETEAFGPEELFIEFGGYVADVIEDTLDTHEDIVQLAGRWFPRSLLADINVGHLNLAEAVLDMHGGGPLTTKEIIEQIGMLDDINQRLAVFSFNYALQEDARFDEVGPAGAVLWYLRRMEPEAVLNPPKWLKYTSIAYSTEDLTPELLELEQEIGDELTKLPRIRARHPESVVVTLTYPHIRAGTMPLSPQLRRMFPTAYEAPRIRFTIIDAETGTEIPAWVVRTDGFVFGIREWLSGQDIPVGGYLTINQAAQAGQVEIAYARRPNARVEWVRTALVEGNRVRYENRSRPIGCDYDDLLIIDVDDTEQMDLLAAEINQREVPLERLIEDAMRELTALTPQGNVHAKTLYSAINVIRRCPPGPIFSRLATLTEYEHVGGPYWSLKDDAGT